VGRNTFHAAAHLLLWKEPFAWFWLVARWVTNDEEEISASLGNQTPAYISYPVASWLELDYSYVWSDELGALARRGRFVPLCGSSAVFVVNPIAMEINGDKLSLRWVWSKVLFVYDMLFKYPLPCSLLLASLLTTRAWSRYWKTLRLILFQSNRSPQGYCLFHQGIIYFCFITLSCWWWTEAIEHERRWNFSTDERKS
jgi:hypothetical protein